jgi:hypothetical protein
MLQQAPAGAAAPYACIAELLAALVTALALSDRSENEHHAVRCSRAVHMCSHQSWFVLMHKFWLYTKHTTAAAAAPAQHMVVQR